MTTYSHGDVVLVPFPFTNMTPGKQRPALVVSANWYNQTRPDCILAGITSTVHTPLEQDEVLIRGQEVRLAGLLDDAVVRAGKLFTIDKSMIIKPLGRLTPASRGKVITCLREVVFAS